MVNTNIKYALIHNEITYVIKFDMPEDITYDLLDEIDYSKISCVCFYGESETSKPIVEFRDHIKEMYPTIKTAWFTNKEKLPFMANKFDYIKIKGALYLNDGQSTSISNRFLDITHDQYVPNPLDPHYFDIIEELKK